MKKWLSQLKKDERGLTLVELLAVVVILAIVAAIAFIMIGNVIENSKKDAHISNAQQIISGVQLGEATGDVDFSGGATFNATPANFDLLGNMVDPWEKSPYTQADVSKDQSSGEYSITLGFTGTGATECPLTDVTERQLQEDGRDICGTP